MSTTERRRPKARQRLGRVKCDVCGLLGATPINRDQQSTGDLAIWINRLCASCRTRFVRDRASRG
jgi:hypothetical protein